MKNLFWTTFAIIAVFSSNSYGALLKISCQFDNASFLNGFNLVTSIESNDEVIYNQALISLKNKGYDSLESDPELIPLTGVKRRIVEPAGTQPHAYILLHLVPRAKNTDIQEMFLQVDTLRNNASVLQTKNKRIYRSNCREVL